MNMKSWSLKSDWITVSLGEKTHGRLMEFLSFDILKWSRHPSSLDSTHALSLRYASVNKQSKKKKYHKLEEKVIDKNERARQPGKQTNKQ